MKYQPFYCEENVWHLADSMRGQTAQVVFISNRDRACAMWKQRAGDPIVWDYHVVLHCQGLIYDYDSRLGSPVTLHRWIEGTFPIEVPQFFAPMFRVIDASRFLEVFASDRSHMRSEEGWQRLPPEWPLIGSGMNLMQFVDMEQEFEGRVVSLTELVAALIR